MVPETHKTGSLKSRFLFLRLLLNYTKRSVPDRAVYKESPVHALLGYNPPPVWLSMLCVLNRKGLLL